MDHYWTDEIITKGKFLSEIKGTLMMVANKVFGSGGVEAVGFIKGRGWVSTERVKTWPWISM